MPIHPGFLLLHGGLLVPVQVCDQLPSLSRRFWLLFLVPPTLAKVEAAAETNNQNDDGDDNEEADTRLLHSFSRWCLLRFILWWRWCRFGCLVRYLVLLLVILKGK